MASDEKSLYNRLKRFTNEQDFQKEYSAWLAFLTQNHPESQQTPNMNLHTLSIQSSWLPVFHVSVALSLPLFSTDPSFQFPFTPFDKLSLRQRKLLACVSSLVAESPLSALNFIATLKSPSTDIKLILTLLDKKVESTSEEKEKTAFRAVIAASITPPQRTERMRLSLVRHYGEKGLQQLAIVCGVAAFHDTITELLCFDIPPPLEKYAQEVLANTGWTVGPYRTSYSKLEKRNQFDGFLDTSSRGQLKSLEEIAAIKEEMRRSSRLGSTTNGSLNRSVDFSRKSLDVSRKSIATSRKSIETSRKSIEISQSRKSIEQGKSMEYIPPTKLPDRRKSKSGTNLPSMERTEEEKDSESNIVHTISVDAIVAIHVLMSRPVSVTASNHPGRKSDTTEPMPIVKTPEHSIVEPNTAPKPTKSTASINKKLTSVIKSSSRGSSIKRQSSSDTGNDMNTTSTPALPTLVPVTSTADGGSPSIAARHERSSSEDSPTGKRASMVQPISTVATSRSVRSARTRGSIISQNQSHGPSSSTTPQPVLSQITSTHLTSPITSQRKSSASNHVTSITSPPESQRKSSASNYYTSISVINESQRSSNFSNHYRVSTKSTFSPPRFSVFSSAKKNKVRASDVVKSSSEKVKSTRSASLPLVFTPDPLETFQLSQPVEQNGIKHPSHNLKRPHKLAYNPFHIPTALLNNPPINRPQKIPLLHPLNPPLHILDKNPTQNHPYLMHSSEKYLCGYIYFKCLPNPYLAAHFTKLLHNAGLSTSQILKATSTARKTPEETPEYPEDYTLLTHILAAKCGSHSKYAYEVAPRLYRASKKNPWAIMEVIGLMGVFAMLHRYSAVMDDMLGLEAEVKEVIQSEYGRELGFGGGGRSEFIVNTPELKESVVGLNIQVAGKGNRNTGKLWGGNIECFTTTLWSQTLWRKGITTDWNTLRDAAFSNTINELLVPDIPPEVEEYATVVLDGTGWNIGTFRSSFRKAVSEHSLAKDKSLSLSLSDLRRRCTSPDLQSPGKFGDTLQVPGMNPVTNGRRRTDYGNTISKPKKVPSNPEGKAPYRTLSFDIPRPSDKDRPRSTRYSTAQFKGGAVKKTMEVASQAAKANQIISTTLKGFPHTTSSLNKWIQENFGFLPRYLTNIHSLDMKRYLCMMLNLLLFTSSDFNTSGHPYLMRRCDKFILGFIYFRSTSNIYLASHFAKLALDNRVDSNMLAKAFERNHGWSGDDSNIPTDFFDLSQLLTAKIATRNVDHYILSMQLMAASRNNPWAVLEVVSLLGLFGLLQRLTAVLDDELGLELEVEKAIQANVKEVLGLNVGKTSANIDSPPFQDKSSNGLLWGGAIRF
ncbi:hypothetical protein BCR33DRAFT_856179 [Rhizoclosmatium globosum]|uniref:Uncharacterized protein n=1 Tax=Rhizoclosmatium globosum TaxID=329046 RepID=A0A1Y2BHD0_9FUNG|nr:hypothetical protein BCR33DRAFT_856179 [Rhizoclosmatium globosum]|eukprot:ORY33917.1 hypothetical protein BCR33DRAFT_856179 [Rhizoclosmatium globosum]